MRQRTGRGILQRRPGPCSLLCAAVLSSVVFFFPASLRAGPDDGLVGYWKCDENRGQTLGDQTGLNGSGALIGNVSWTTGESGSALAFDGSTGYVKVGTSPALANLSVFSISIWAKITSVGSADQEILERGSAYFLRGAISLSHSASRHRFMFSFFEVDAANDVHLRYAYSPFLWTPNQWHHVVVTSNGTTVTVFVDGLSGIPVTVARVDPLEDGDAATNFAKAMYMGALVDQSETPVHFLGGSVDEIRWYNRELPLADIVALYGSKPASYTFPTNLATTPWPKLYGRAGPYSVMTAQDVADMVGAGFDLVLAGYYPTSPVGQAFADNSVRQIIPITGKLYELCPPGGGSCVLSASDEQAVLDYARSIITASANDPLVVGYWTIDDSPGDVSAIVQEFHALIAEANQTSIFARPAICGLGGTLDYKQSASDANFLPAGIAYDSFVNINPTACDMVGLYLYGMAAVDDPGLVDWSMRYMLPQVLDGLRLRGWDQSQQPLLALPHTFNLPVSGSQYFVLPRAADVAAQTESYCRAGAIALLPYAWHTSPSGSTHALWDIPDLVTGLEEGRQVCQTQYWTFDTRPMAPRNLRVVGR